MGPYREAPPKARRRLDVEALAVRLLVAGVVAFVEWLPVACVIAAWALPEGEPYRVEWIAVSCVLVVVVWSFMSCLRAPYAFRAIGWVARRAIDAYQRDVWRQP